MNPEEFRKYGKEVVDWIADYLKDAEKYPVFPSVQPGDIKKQLPAFPPSSSENMEMILKDFDRIILPGITHWNHPDFFAYFANSASAAGILGEMLATALNVNGMLWRTSPAATELEELVTDWMRQMLGLPTEFKGIINDTASVSTLVALTAARERIKMKIREEGLAGRKDLPQLRIYCSEHAHSSVEKAAIIIGVGQEGVRKIPVDSEFRLRTELLTSAIEEDRKKGFIPFAVVATVGTTSSTSIDPVPAIADICEKEKLWLHVDGAYGAMAAIVSEMRNVIAGCERADSIVTNPHKWLLTPMDCSLLFTKDVTTVKQAFSLVPEYLKTADPSVNNYMDWGVQLGRRFRSLKLWFIIRSFGVSGLIESIRKHCRLAREFAGWVDADKNFERLALVPFSVVCFRYHPKEISDEAKLERLNALIVEQVNSSGKIFLSHTKLDDKYAIRIAIGNLATTQKHTSRAWELIKSIALQIKL